MKVTTSNETVIERNGVSDEGSFRIAFNSKMAKILSDGLYSDKIGSIIREISCNGADSHVEAGFADKPIIVHLPSNFEPWFYVEDTGMGLDHQQVMDIYTVYGVSTKTNSNDLIGQLGLGSKSPFSYVDAFDVTAIKDGIERQYSMYKNEHGMPSVATLATNPTTKPNGVKVNMPVNPSDIREFKEKAATIFQHWDIRPEFNNGSPEFFDTERLFSGAGWYINKPVAPQYYGNNRNKSYVIMGRVSYPIDNNIILSSKEYKNSFFGNINILDLPLVIGFNIGDLEVAASREALSYDSRTIKNIVERLAVVEGEVKSQFKNALVDAKTEWEARIIWETKRKELNNILHNFGNTVLKNALWNGKTINESYIRLDTAKFWKSQHLSFCKYIEPSGSKVKTIDTQEIRAVYCDKDTQFVFDDTENGISHNKIRYYHYLNGDLSKAGKTGLNASGAEKTTYLMIPDLKTIPEMVEELGNPPYILASQLPKVPVVRTAKSTEEYDISEYIGGYNNRNSPSSWNKLNVNKTADIFKKGGYYVVLNGFDWIDTRKNDNTAVFHRYLSTIKENLIAFKIIPEGTKIYAGRNKTKTQMISDKNPQWIDLLKFADVEIKKCLTKEVVKAHYMRDIMTSYAYGELSKLNTKKLSDSSLFSDFVQTLQKQGEIIKEYDKNKSLYTLAENFGIKISEYYSNIITTDELIKKIKNIPTTAETVYKTYPMVKYAIDNYRTVDQKLNDTISDYINLVDYKINLDKNASLV